MKTFYLEPVTDDMIAEKLCHEVGEDIRHWERKSSSHKKYPYEITNEADAKYLDNAKKIIGDVGDFIRDFLPGFPSHQRKNFNYVRAQQVEFLERHELMVTVRAETFKEKKELRLRFDLPSSVFIPRILHRIKGQYVYLYNHLESRISFVIGNPENPKNQDYFIDDAMEEFWHLALYPYLVERLNRNLQCGAIEPSDSNISKILVLEGELLSKAFALASLDELKQENRYGIPWREPKVKEKVYLAKIQNIGIRKALKEVGKIEGF